MNGVNPLAALLDPGDCPPWCGLTGAHTVHIGAAGVAGQIGVGALLDDVAGYQVLIALYENRHQVASVMLPPKQAVALAAIFRAGECPQVAGLIDAAVTMVDGFR